MSTVRFCDVDLLTAPDALVPRAETELLARQALARAAELTVDGELRVIDMCCGAGNLACALAVHIPTARVWASDLTDPCVTLARRNVERLQLRDRVVVRQGDLFAALADDGLAGRVDLIVCNPPYISTGKLDGERADLLVNEPREAFDGGAYGLTIHQRVLKQAPDYLKPRGWLLFEIGLGQERQVEALFARAHRFDDVRSAADSDGNPRVIMGRRVKEEA